MSDALTPNAPADEAAAPSVEDTAPATEAAVESGSAGGEASVPADRFNGLMSTFQRTKNELEAERTRRAELEALLASREETTNVSDDALRDEVSELRQALAEERMERARDKVLDKYPEARPLADLIVGNSVEDLEAVAATIAERLRGLTPAQTAEVVEEVTDEANAAATQESVAGEQVATQEVQEAPVLGTGGQAPGNEPVGDRVADALQRGDFSAFMQAKYEQLAAGGTLG